MDAFFQICMKNEGDKSRLEKRADEVIIKDLDKGIKKPPIGKYNDPGNANFSMFTPGNIYLFNYDSDSMVSITTSTATFEFFDKHPLVLVTSIGQDKTISGLNLNYCPFVLKACILNEIVNLDERFFYIDGPAAFSNGVSAYSKTWQSTFLDAKFEEKFKKLIELKYSTEDCAVVFRKYKLSNASKVKVLEYWMWDYVPFLKYNSSIREATLKLVQSAMIKGCRR